MEGKMKRVFVTLLGVFVIFAIAMTIAVRNFMLHDLHDTTLFDEPDKAPVVECSMCGSQMNESTEKSDYVLTEEGLCTHGKPFGYDSVYIRQINVYQRCGSCGYDKLLSEKIETKTECHGHY